MYSLYSLYSVHETTVVYLSGIIPPINRNDCQHGLFLDRASSSPAADMPK
jgi:hypothetical protein